MHTYRSPRPPTTIAHAPFLQPTTIVPNPTPRSQLPQPPLVLAARRNDNDDGNDEAAAPDPLLSRRELLVPTLLSLGSGIAILTNGIRDERAYDAEHKALFGAIEVRACGDVMCVCV